MPKHPSYRRAALRTGEYITNVADHLSLKKCMHWEQERKVHPETKQPQKRKRRKSSNLSGYLLFISCSNLPFTETLAYLLCILLHPELQQGSFSSCLILWKTTLNTEKHWHTQQFLQTRFVIHVAPLAVEEATISLSNKFCNSYYTYLYLKTK